jgi:pimeloyl-ACP methyl ester carboxylesterase
VGAFMNAVGFERGALVGNSRGGLVAISLAAAHPERVSRLILAGNSGGAGTAPPVPGNPPSTASAVRTYQPGRDELRHILGLSYFDPDASVSPQTFEQYLETSIVQYGAYEKAGGYPLDVPNLAPQLQGLSIPVLFVFGKEDRMVTVDRGVAGLRLASQGTLVVFSRCGHHPQSEHPAEFNRLAVQFLQGDLG